MPEHARVPRRKDENFELEFRHTQAGSSSITTGTAVSSTYQPSTGHDPYRLQKRNHTSKRAIIKEEMKDVWTEASPIFIDTFFPDTEAVKKCVKTLREKYTGNIVDSVSSNTVPPRWKDFPHTPPPDVHLNAKQTKIFEKEITSAFVPILNHIVATLGLSDSRVAVDGQTFKIATCDGGTLKPDVFFWGTGSCVFPSIKGRPETVARKSQEPQKSARKGAKSSRASRFYPEEEPEVPPEIDWPWCCAPIEVKTFKTRGGPDNKDAFVQLGTYVREVFAAQSNRSFLPSLILTEKTIEFLLWDRRGAIFSERINFHEKPYLFCRILVNLASWGDRDLGFDISMFYNNERPQQLCIKVWQPNSPTGRCKMVTYTIRETLIRSYTLQGRGTTVWRCQSDVDEDSWFVIQDSWAECAPGQEHAFGPDYDIICRLEKEDVGLGGELIHVEDVRQISNFGPGEKLGNFRLDSVLNNRHQEALARTEVDLVHIRSIWKYDAKLLEDFEDNRELLYALRSVAYRLRAMFLRTSVIHRDITPWNVLISRRLVAGPLSKRNRCSFLLDFSCAAVANSDNIEPRSEPTPAAQLFSSCNPLVNSPKAHLADLESLYWILCFIITGHGGPVLRTTRLGTSPVNLQLWNHETPGGSEMAKKGHLQSPVFFLPIQAGFTELEPLTRKLHAFFCTRILSDDAGRPRPTVMDDYEEFIGHFTDAIERLQAVHLPLIEGLEVALPMKRDIDAVFESGDEPEVSGDRRVRA